MFYRSGELNVIIEKVFWLGFVYFLMSCRNWFLGDAMWYCLVCWSPSIVSRLVVDLLVSKGDLSLSRF